MCYTCNSQPLGFSAGMDQLLQEKFSQLADGINALLQEKNALKEEIRYYQAENRELRQALQSPNNPKPDLIPVAGDSNLANKNGSYAEKIAAIANKIDVYVEEIDRCIAQLGK